MSLETARRVLKIEAQAIQDVLERLDGALIGPWSCCSTAKAAWWFAAWANPDWSRAKFLRRSRAPARLHFFCIRPKRCMAIWACWRRGDAVLAVSYGGETEEIVRLLEALKRLEISLVTLTGKTSSTLAEASDVVLDVSVREEACSLNLAPTASTTVAMAVGDALAVALLERRGFRHDDFAALHPGGRLGNKLLRVEHVMHAGEALPRVSPRHSDARCVSRDERQRSGHDHGGGSRRPPWRAFLPTAICGD